jgi:hypothetical protein
MSMTTIYWEMSRSMQICDFVVLLKSRSIRYFTPGVCQTRVPYLIFGFIIARKYKMLNVLGQYREIMDEKWSAARFPCSPPNGKLKIFALH